MSISYKFTEFEVKQNKKISERKCHYFLGSTSNLEFHTKEEQKIKEEKWRKV